MRVFAGTSALYAILDRDDSNHRAAADIFPTLLEHEKLFTHSYVAIETSALVQRRLGMEAARTLHDDVLPALELSWVDESLHRAGVAAMLASGACEISLVDWTSFELMRRLGVSEAFAFDDDFPRQGFTLVSATD